MLAIVAAGLYFASSWWLPAAGHWLDVGEPPQPADYCLVLSGDEQSRPFAAAALYRRGYVRRQIWLTHAAMPDTPVAERADANNRVRRIFAVLGVPADRIVELPGDCTNTFDEIAELARAMAEHHGATVNIVTSNYHTRRARWIVEHTLGADAARVRYVSAPTDYFDADCWWKVEEGFTTYSKEFAKNIFYIFRYGWTGIGLVVAIVAATAARFAIRCRRRRRSLAVPR